MSDDPNDKVGKPVTGLITGYWPSEGKNDPHAIHVKDYDERFTTFDDETAEPLQTGIKVTFRAEKNGDYWNIKEGTVAVVDSDPGPAREQRGQQGDIRNSECVQTNGDTGETRMFSMNDARIMSQSIVRSAVLFHQDREDSTVEDVEETAHRLADLEPELVRQLRSVPLGGETA